MTRTLNGTLNGRQHQLMARQRFKSSTLTALEVLVIDTYYSFFSEKVGFTYQIIEFRQELFIYLCLMSYFF